MYSRFRQKDGLSYLRSINWIVFIELFIVLIMIGWFLDNFVEPLLVCGGVFANAICLVKLLMPGSEDAIKVMVDILYALIGSVLYGLLKRRRH
jgi:hypothetical protein